MLGGSLPPKPTPRLVIVAGGLGETRVADAIARRLRDERGVECAILTRTDSSFTVKTAPTFLGRLPYNSPLAVPIFLLRWRPRAIVTIEFNDYHHLKAMARLARIRQITINVPVTEGEAERVLGKPGTLWRWHLVDSYLASHKAVEERLKRFGIPAERILTTGPLGLLPALGPGLSKTDLLLAPEDGPVIVAGSTYPVDEPLILAAFDAVRARHPRAVLILAPRKIVREIDASASLRGRDFVRRSERRPLGDARVLLLDTYGELKEVYACADLAVVGGTYGMDNGGHTPVEAIAWGVPAIIGPIHRQQVHTVEWLTEAGATFVYESPEHLRGLMGDLLGDPERLEAARSAARRVAAERVDPVLDVYDALLAPVLHSGRTASERQADQALG